MQTKQASSSVYEAYRGRSRHPNHGERVGVGKRLIQSATDIRPRERKPTSTPIPWTLQTKASTDPSRSD